MTMHRVAWTFAVVIVLAGSTLAGSTVAADKPEDAAQASAEAWLQLVDAGDYDASWEQSASLLKGAVPKDRWRQDAAGVRKPLGQLISRKMKSREYTEKIPGAPDGKYVVIRFETVFQKKTEAIETITPMLDADGAWRVAGYFIR